MIAEITTGGIILQFLTGTTGGIVKQLILGCNSKSTVMFYKGKTIVKYNNPNYWTNQVLTISNLQLTSPTINGF